MKEELIIAIVAVLSWVTATFFTNSVSSVVDGYFVEKYHHKALVYALCSLLFLLITVYFSQRVKSRFD